MVPAARCEPHGAPLRLRKVTAARLTATMETIVAVEPRSRPPVPHLVDADGGAQAFVARLRRAAALFAAAAGAQTAGVREVVPPAPPRRSPSRIGLGFPDGGEAALAFVGPPAAPRRTVDLGE